MIFCEIAVPSTKYLVSPENSKYLCSLINSIQEMKKVLSFCFAALMALLSVYSCDKNNKEDDVIALDGLTIYPEELEMAVEETQQLYAILLPPNATNQDVVWSSDQPDITVSETGLVRAGLGEGDAIITAHCGDKVAHCNVRVVVPVRMFNFTSSLQSKSLAVGESFPWSVVCNPPSATDSKNIVFENSDPSVADLTLDNSNPAKFTVKAKKLGSTIITAKCGGKEAELLICVDAVKATKVTLDPDHIILGPISGSTRRLKATVEPSNATNKTILWYSMDPEKATVEDGLVTALRPGTVTIAAYCGEAFAYCDVTVEPLPDGLVDLGLSVLWSDRNLGASAPDKPGDYYAWGETSPKSDYSWSNYKFWESGDRYTNVVLTRYNDSDEKYAFSAYDYEDDAARQVLGGKWRVPLSREFSELIENCQIDWADDSHQCIRFTSKVTGYTDQSIILPLGGVAGMDKHYTLHFGEYWCSNRYIYSHSAMNLHLGDIGEAQKTKVKIETAPREQGYTIRPVW